MKGLLCAILTFAALGCSGTRRSGLLLELKPPVGKTLDYSISRKWRANPPDTGNGNQDHALVASVSFDPTSVSGETRAIVSVKAFHGEDLANKYTKHLQQIKPAVEKLSLVRFLTGSGKSKPWEISDYNEAGWAGMMAWRALGLYEVGFFELAYPTHPVQVGDEWKAPVAMGETVFEAGDETRVIGEQPDCVYRLEAVDPDQNTAKISFSVSTAVFIVRPDGTRGPSVDKSSSGYWIVDVATGLPKEFHSTQKTIENGTSEDVTTIAVDMRYAKG